MTLIEEVRPLFAKMHAKQRRKWDTKDLMLVAALVRFVLMTIQPPHF